jgi:ankyrin repeat protein
MAERDRKPKWLRKAASAGDAARIRELLAEGAPIETPDENQKTPVMLAAQGGHWDAFKALVDAGANLHHLALTQVDLLECAAAGGNVEIIRFLLGHGHPIEGHANPSDWKSRELRRLGHLTPLNMAAIYGHVEAVRVLLQAGANRNAMYDEETPLMRVRDMIRHPIDDGQAARKADFEAVVALLDGP